MGIQYRFTWLYRLLIPIIHRKKVVLAFKRAVGTDVSVLDVACGYGQMLDYMDESVEYNGIDLNEHFLAYAKKHGRNVKRADIFDKKSYKHVDVVCLVDVIHHLPEERLPELFDLLYSHAKKRVVVLEPAFVDLADKYGWIGKPIDWLFKKLDNDGINEIEKWLSEEEYIELFDTRFSSNEGKHFNVNRNKVWPYHVVVFERK